MGDRGAQPRRLSRFRELKFTYVGFLLPVESQRQNDGERRDAYYDLEGSC